MTINALVLDRDARSSIVEALVSKIEAYYVFPEVAEEIGRSIRGLFESGAYEDCVTGADLSERLTNDLQKINGDKHLRLIYTEEPQAFQENVNIEDDPVWLEEYRQECLLYNFGFAKVERLPGNVGYLDVRAFYDAWMAGEAASHVMSLLAYTSALIIDLRACGGGDPAMVALLCSYLFGIEPVHLNDLYFRPTNSTQQYWTVPYVQGKRYTDKLVYVLTSHETFSGAEEFAYNLKNLQRATIVGEITGGGANPRDAYQIHPHFQAHVPIGRAINPITGTNWEGVGVQPDIEVPGEKALRVAHAEALKKVLAELGDSPVGPFRGLAEEVKKTLGELEKVQ